MIATIYESSYASRTAENCAYLLWKYRHLAGDMKTLQNLGLKPAKGGVSQTARPMTEPEKERILELFDAGTKLADIVPQVGRSYETVRRVCKLAGRDIATGQKKRSWTKKPKEVQP